MKNLTSVLVIVLLSFNVFSQDTLKIEEIKVKAKKIKIKESEPLFKTENNTYYNNNYSFLLLSPILGTGLTYNDTLKPFFNLGFDLLKIYNKRVYLGFELNFLFMPKKESFIRFSTLIRIKRLDIGFSLTSQLNYKGGVFCENDKYFNTVTIGYSLRTLNNSKKNMNYTVRQLYPDLQLSIGKHYLECKLIFYIESYWNNKY